MRFYFKRHFLSHCLACSTMFSFEMLRNSPFKIKLKQKPKKKQEKKRVKTKTPFLYLSIFFSNKKKNKLEKVAVIFVMKSSLLNSHDIPTDYRYIFCCFYMLFTFKSFSSDITKVPVFRAKGIKIIGDSRFMSLTICALICFCVLGLI